MFSFFATVALAAPLELTPTPGARVEVLPAMVAGRVDVLVHDNTADLHEQVRWPLGDGLRRVRALNLGGDWIVSIELSDPELGVTAAPTATGWELTLGPRPPEDTPVYGPVDLVGALAGDVDTHACSAPKLPVVPLSGPDAPFADDALGPPPRMPTWAEMEPTVVGWGELADTWQLRARAGADLAASDYRIAALLRDLGQLREAAYYFARAGAEGAPPEARFQEARVRLAVRQWAAAATAAQDAAAAGGAPEVALEVVALAAHHTADPAALGYARALAATSVDPEAQLVAASLLVDGGCAGEAVPLLQGLVRQTEGTTRELARLFLGDGHLAHGNVDDAARAYASARPSGLPLDAQRVLRGRTRLLALLAVPPARWGSALPDLERAAELPGPGGLESLYEVAQVRAHLGLAEESLDAYARLVRRAPSLALGHVGAELTGAWKERSAALFAERHVVEALALHRGAWTPALAVHLADPAPLRQIAEGYAEAGLPGRALETWQAVADLERRDHLDGRETVRQLARLYAATGDHADALDAIGWLRKQKSTREEAEALDILEGDAALQSGDRERARAVWGHAKTSTTAGVYARARIGLLDADAGDCVAALPALDEAAAGAPMAGVDDRIVHEARLRCYVATGRAADATTEAVATAGLAGDDRERDWTTWRARRMDVDGAAPARPLLADAAAASSGIWGDLAREEAAHRTFVDQLAARRRP